MTQVSPIRVKMSAYPGFGPGKKRTPFRETTYGGNQTDYFYDNVDDIHRWVYRIWVTLVIIGMIFALLLAAAVTLTGVIVAHRSVLSELEKKAGQILEAFRIFINETYSVTKDLDSNYQRAKEIHIAKMKSMGQDSSFLSSNEDGGGLDTSDDLHNIQNETYVSHFMNILLHVLPLHDDEAMVEKITNTMNGWDSLMGLIQQANRTGIVGNTSILEYHVNQVLGNEKTKEVASKGADLVEDVINRRTQIVAEYFLAKRQAGNTLSKADALLQTPLVTSIMNKQAVLEGLAHLGVNVNEAMDDLFAFGQTQKAKDIADDIVNTIGAARHFHLLRYLSESLKLASDLGSRTAGIDLQKEMNDDNQDFKKDAQDEAKAWLS